jgi:hypothetical protein
MLDFLMDSVEFQNWYRKPAIDIDPESLVITNAKGDERHLDELFRNYVQIPRDIIIAQELEDQAEVRFVPQYDDQAIVITRGREEFAIHPLAYHMAGDRSIIKEKIAAIDWLLAEEKKGFKELDFYYKLHKEALSRYENLRALTSPWYPDMGVPKSFDEFMKGMLRNRHMRLFVMKNLHLEEMMLKYNPGWRELDYINTLPQPTLPNRSEARSYDGWFPEGANPREGVSAYTMIEAAIGYARMNGNAFELQLLDIIKRRYADHLKNQVVRTTDQLVDAEGVQKFSMRDGGGYILLSEVLQQDSEIYRVLVHELIHSVTKQLLVSENLNEAEARFVNRIASLYNLAKSRATDEHYQVFSMKGLDSLEEFVAELFSNMEFRKAVETMTYQGSTNLWQKFVEWVKALFGFGEDHFQDIFDIQNLVRQVSSFQRATNHEFPLHESYSKAAENPAFDPENINEDTRSKLAHDFVQFYENMINELYNSPMFYFLSDKEIESRVEKIEAKLRLNRQMIEDGDLYTVFQNFLSEGHRELIDMQNRLSLGMEAVDSSELAFWLKQLQALEEFMIQLRNLSHVDGTWEQVLGDDGMQQLSGDLSLIDKNLGVIRQHFTSLGIGALVPYDSVTEFDWIEKAKTEYRRTVPKKDRDKNEQRKFVAEYMKRHQAQIMDDKQQRLFRSLRYLPKDILFFLNRAQPYAQSTDSVTALAKLFLDEVDDKARAQYSDLEVEFVKRYDAYINAVGKRRSFIDLWEPLLEKDKNGKVTGQLVSKYRMAEWHTARSEFEEEIDGLLNDGTIDEIEAGKRLSKFYRENSEREYIDLWYDLLENYGKIHSEQSEMINRQVWQILGGFKGDWVDPEAFSVSELLHLGKMYREIDIANKDQPPAELFKEAKRAGIKIDQDPNPRHKEYLKKIVALKRSAQMTDAAAKEIVDALSYDTWAWEEETYIDNEGNEVTTKKWKETRKPLPFLSRMKPTAIQGGPLTTVKNNKWVEGEFTLKEGWKNSEYDAMLARPADDPVREMWEFMTKWYLTFDKHRPPDKRLNFRLPGMRKTRYEMLAESEMSGAKKLNTFLFDSFRIHMDNIEWGDITTEKKEVSQTLKEDLRGNIYKYVPIHFTGRPESIEMQSFDLATMFLANAEMSIKHQFLVKHAPELEGIADIMKNVRTVGSGERRRGDERERESKPSKAEKFYALMLEDKLYGMRRSPDQNKQWVQALDAIQNYSSMLYLGFNVFASMQNTLYGRISTTLETLSGGMLSSAGRWKAENAYKDNMLAMTTDWYNQRSTARVHQIMDMFDGVKDFSSRRNDYGRHTNIRKFLHSDNLFQLHMSGEHYVQHIVALTVLADTLVMNDEGNYINAKGEVVDSPADAMNLLDAMMVGNDGILEVNEHVKKIEWRGHIKDWSKKGEMRSKKGRRHGENEALTFLTSRMQSLNTMIHGNYGDRAKAELERYWQFRMGTQLRKWLIMGYRRRWIMDGAASKEWLSEVTNKETRKSDDFEQLWERKLAVGDHDLAIQNEGMYITVFKYMSAVYNALRNNAHRFGESKNFGDRMGYAWESFNSHQRANVKRVGVETAMTVVFSMLMPLIAMWMEDDDEEGFIPGIDVMSGMAFSFWRMSTELGLYYNPVKLLSVLQNPAVSLGFLSDIAQFVEQTGSDVFTLSPDRYKAGGRKGQFKWWKKFTDVVPGARSIHSLFYLKDKMNYRNMNQ